MDSLSIFLSHLSGDEVSFMTKHKKKNFLSHLSGDEDIKTLVVANPSVSKSPER